MHKAHDSKPHDGRDIHTADGRDDLAGSPEQWLCRHRDINPGRLGEVGLGVPAEDDADYHDKVEDVDTGACKEFSEGEKGSGGRE